MHDNATLGGMVKVAGMVTASTAITAARTAHQREPAIFGDATPHRHEQAESRHWIGPGLDNVAVATDAVRLLASYAVAAIAARAIEAIWSEPREGEVPLLHAAAPELDAGDLFEALVCAVADEGEAAVARRDLEGLGMAPLQAKLRAAFGFDPKGAPPVNQRVRDVIERAAAAARQGRAP